MNFKDTVKTFLKESEVTEKLSGLSFLTGRLKQAERKILDPEGKVAVKKLQAILKQTDVSPETKRTQIKKVLDELEKKDPDLVKKLNIHLPVLKVSTGEHTPPVNPKNPKRNVYKEIESAGLKGDEKSKALKAELRDEKKSKKEDIKASSKWKAGTELEDDDEEAGFKTRLGGPTSLTASKDWKKAVMRYRLGK